MLGLFEGVARWLLCCFGWFLGCWALLYVYRIVWVVAKAWLGSYDIQDVARWGANVCWMISGIYFAMWLVL